MNRKRTTVDMATGDLFADASGSGVAAALTASSTLELLRQWADAGLLRRLDAALAAFVLEHDPQVEPCVLAATAVVAQMEGRGHSCLPLAELVATPVSVLGWMPPDSESLLALWGQLPASLPAWLQALAACRLVRRPGHDADQGQPLVLAGVEGPSPLLYLRRYWDHERMVAGHIRQRSQATGDGGGVDVPAARQWLDRFFPAAGGADCNWQKVACALALRGRLAVITGGPGTGKTYTAARLLALLFATAPDAGQLRVALAAPTGKAAARLKQAIDGALGDLQAQLGDALDLDGLVQRVGGARTLHALLGAHPGTRHFSHHAGRPLDVDVLIVDEASMVHLEMMAALLDALPPTARLVLLGDKDQLASVEAGSVLGDLCRGAEAGGYGADTVEWVARLAGEAIPARFQSPEGAALSQQTVMLRTSRRFGGPIGQLAMAVNQGDARAALATLHEARASQGVAAEVALAQGVPVQQAVALALQGRAGMASYAAYAQALARWPEVQHLAGLPAFPAAHAAWVADVLAAFDRFRLLCAVREGDWGVAGLNRAVERALDAAGHIRRSGEWYAGRPVMVSRNDAALGVFNGDIGMALPGAAPGHALRVFFPQGGQVRSVGVTRLAQVETAFAMTVHKSQGSEFEHTALVLSAAAGGVLGRELVYTGITRARQAFTLLAERPGLLEQAIAWPTRRASGLPRFLDGWPDPVEPEPTGAMAQIRA